jgi:charged multivesicular body protein 3
MTGLVPHANTNALCHTQAKNRMFEVRATMKMMQNQLSQQAAILKVAGTMAKSAEIMKCLNSIMSTSKMSAEMQVLTKEMMKAGVVEDVFEEAFVEEGLEEEADYEVNKILMEVVPDMPDAPWRAVPEVSAVADLEYEGKGVADDGVTDAAEDPEVAALQARAGAL